MKQKKKQTSLRKNEKLFLLVGGVLLIIGIGWYSINVMVPQKKQMHREQNMRMWNSKGRQFLSRMSYCNETTNATDMAEIKSYGKTHSSDQSTAQKSCQKAKEQVSDILSWCEIDIPQQLQNEGLESNNKNYQQKKDFVLNLCEVLEKSNFGQEK